ncbi:P-II family nitrogen regulator [Candidatus Desulforudis audaxviator]|uniref:Nitrogen regulatory protein P-II n=1 Tax=Desulforudis audaxviator (strain MP104C) TaxID=477974 RepID=B1I0Y9_DESAP|nr:P-II family nitrogen regulator [Candidatus Desulforudis audaxviator]ACA58712.1 nitrogen regulatory protein P-II [Candidatus Desulforudis audaxviator MP104C]AZK58714.1 Nitrogen regulatory protein P-II [Candidatus Desulforudis audaxviator]
MKKITAIVRPERAEEVAEALGKAGFAALTKMDVAGRGKQMGLRMGSVYYDELPKTMFWLVVQDERVAEAVEVISKTAYTGNFGDGKIFVSPVEEAYTIRTGVKEL